MLLFVSIQIQIVIGCGKCVMVHIKSIQTVVRLTHAHTYTHTHTHTYTHTHTHTTIGVTSEHKEEEGGGEEEEEEEEEEKELTFPEKSQNARDIQWSIKCILTVACLFCSAFATEVK